MIRKRTPAAITMERFEITYQVSIAGEPLREFRAVVEAKSEEEIGALIRAHVLKKVSVMIVTKTKANSKKKAA